MRSMQVTGRAAALALVVLALAPAARAAPRPDVLWADGDSLVTGTAAGAELARLPALDFATLADGLVVGTRTVPGASGSDRVVVRRAATGALVRTFTGAFASVPLPGGKRILFTNDRFQRRDVTNAIGLYVGTIATGAVRRIRRFDLPGSGYQTGIESGTLLSLRPRPDGRWVALTWGNDVDLFQSDVFLVRIADGRVRRLTTTGTASYPDWSPDGRRLVYVRARGRHLTPGDLAGSLVLRRADGTGARVLAKATAGTFYVTPRWVSPTTIWALRMTASGGAVTTSRLVAIDVATGARSAVSGAGVRVEGFSRIPGGALRVENRGGATPTSVVVGPGAAVTALPGGSAESRGDRAWP